MRLTDRKSPLCICRTFRRKGRRDRKGQVPMRYRLSALSNLHRAPRDPFLYLRSFAMEVDANPERRSLKTDEEDLALALNHLGPVVAIGDPNEGEGLPMLGATRIYFADDKWQESIERLLSSLSWLSSRRSFRPGSCGRLKGSCNGSNRQSY